MTDYLKKLYEIIKKNAAKRKVYIHFENKKFTYKALLWNIQKITAFFQSEGFKVGERLVILTRHEKYAASIFISALFNGLCPVVLPLDIKLFRLNSILDVLKPSAFFIDRDIEHDEFLPDLNTILMQVERGLLYRFSRKFLIKYKRPDLEKCFPALLDGLDKIEPINSHIELENSAYIIFTSGSTSCPKGVEHTHNSLFSHMETLKEIFNYNENAIIFNNIDLSHADGLLHGVLISAYTGATLVRARPFSIALLEPQLNAICRYNISHFITMPTVLAWIDKFTREKDYFSHGKFKYVISVASKLEAPLWQRLNDRFNLKICNMYGLTETVSGGIFCMADSDSYQIGSVGLPKKIEVAILKNNSIYATGYGELLMKGDSVFKGYYNNKEASLSAFYQGWLRTGDMAEIEETGSVSIKGRRKSTIISGGRNIEPDEVDEVLQYHELIHFSRTMGLIDHLSGQIVVSAIEAQESLLDEIVLIQHCLKYLEAYKIPKKFFFLDKIPRGKSGKVLEPELLAIVQAREDCLNHPFERKKEVIASDIIKIAAQSFKLPVSQLSIHTASESTALWDSLGHINFMVELEKYYSIKLGLREIMGIRNLGQAIEIVQAKV